MDNTNFSILLDSNQEKKRKISKIKPVDIPNFFDYRTFKNKNYTVTILKSICKKYNLKYTLDLHENRHEIMKSYKHVNSFLGKLLISVKRWKKAEEEYVSKAEKVIVVTNQAKKEIIKRCKISNDNVVVYPNTVRKSFYQNKD